MVNALTFTAPAAKLSKITGSAAGGYTTKVTDAKTGAPLNVGTIRYYGTPGYLCTAEVVNGSATCSVPASQGTFVKQLRSGFGVTGVFSAPGYAEAQTTNGLPGAPGID